MRRNASGFTLIEVIVAFAVLALMMGPVLQAFSSGLAAADRTADVATATALAKSKMAEIGAVIPIVAGEHGGRFENTRFGWRLAIAPLETSADDGAPALYRVQATVSWADAGRDRSLDLITMRLGGAR